LALLVGKRRQEGHQNYKKFCTVDLKGSYLGGLHFRESDLPGVMSGKIRLVEEKLKAVIVVVAGAVH